MGKRNQKRERLKGAILENATRIFLEKGYASATMKEIAEAAGVGAGTAYNYFGSKADLFLTVLSRQFDEAAPAQAAPENGGRGDPLWEVRSYVDDRIAFFKAFDKSLLRDLFGLVSERGRHHSCLLEWFIEWDTAFREQLAVLLEAMKDRGGFKPAFDPEAASRILHGVLSQYGTEYAFDEAWTFGEYRDSVMEAIDFVLKDKLTQGEETHG